MSKSLVRFTYNLSAKSGVRREMLEGREHLVVPTVMMVEGVLAGSDGPLLYLAEDFKENPQLWDHKPIVVYHPEENGHGVSACDADIINSQKIGVLLNTRSVGKKLKTESWIDIERANAIDARIVEAIEAKKPMDVSTGLWVDREDVEGEYNGRAYEGIARNYVPDHLAVLPDQKGACSIEDGAGLLLNHAKPEKAISRNELSFSSIQSYLRSLLRDKLMLTEDYPTVYISDVFPAFVVYEWSGKLYKIGYTKGSDDTISLTGEPEEVIPSVSYKTKVSNQLVGNSFNFFREPEMPTKVVQDRKEAITKLIANAKGIYTEEDREDLAKLPDAQFAKLEKAFANHKAESDPAPVLNKKKKVLVKNEGEDQKSKKKRLREYLDEMPKALRRTIQNAMLMERQRKMELIKEIVANKNNKFKEDYLEKQAVPFLEAMAALARGKSQSLTNNRRDEEDEDDDFFVDEEDVDDAIFVGNAGAAPTGNAEQTEGLLLPGDMWAPESK